MIEALPETAGAADIGWDAQRQRLLMPILYENRVVLRGIPKAGRSGGATTTVNVIRGYFDIWNTRSLDDFDRFVASDIRFRDEANDVSFTSSEELVKFMQEAWIAAPDIFFALDQISDAGGRGSRMDDDRYG